MNKHCGQTRFLHSLVIATLFALALATSQARADAISVGNGVIEDGIFGGGCWHGLGDAGLPAGCEKILPSEQVNLVLGESISIHMKNSTIDGGAYNPVLLIFAVPIENLLAPFNNEFIDFGPTLNPGLSIANILPADGAMARLYNAPLPDLPVTGHPAPPVSKDIGVDFSNDSADNTATDGVAHVRDTFHQGDVFNSGVLYGPDGSDPDNFLGLGDAPNSNSFAPNWQDAMFTIPQTLALSGFLDDVIFNLLGLPSRDAFISQLIGAPGNDPVSGFTIWVFELLTNEFSDGDVIHVDTDGIPLGTLVTAWATGEKKNGQETADAPPFTKIAVMMPVDFRVICQPGVDCIPEIPEPASLLLLGTGLLGIGRQWRKRQQSRKQAEDQNVA